MRLRSLDLMAGIPTASSSLVSRRLRAENSNDGTIRARTASQDSICATISTRGDP
jgi:hypothetical protein